MRSEAITLVAGLFLGASGLYVLQTFGMFAPVPKSKKRNQKDPTSEKAVVSSAQEPSSEKLIEKGKIAFNELDVIGCGQSKVYRGTFENIPVAVKKITNIDENQKGSMNKELKSINDSLKHREVEINRTHTEWGHPNVVRYFGSEIIDAINGKFSLLLALDLCQLSLEEFVHNRTTSTFALTDQEIFLQMADGLGFLHSRNIVHRDLKPSNVMIKTDDKNIPLVKIADFGLSKLLPDDTSESKLSYVCGTKGWMAPELSDRGSESSDELYRFKRCDIYSLGLIFFFVASNGKMLFTKERKITEGDYKLIRSDFTLLSLLNKMTHETPTERVKIDKVVKHPALWTTKRTLQFFAKVSDYLVAQQPSLANILENPNVINMSWNAQLPQTVNDYLFPPRSVRRQSGGARYNPTSLQSLLRVIRNCVHHLNEFPEPVQREFGDSLETMLEFWTSRFSQLLTHTYETMRPHNIPVTEFEEFY